MDLVSTSHNLDGRLIDPTVVDPATPDEVMERAATSAVARPTRVVDDAEAAKVAHYPDVPPGFTLCPVGITTQGTCGALGKQFLITDLGRPAGLPPQRHGHSAPAAPGGRDARGPRARRRGADARAGRPDRGVHRWGLAPRCAGWCHPLRAHGVVPGRKAARWHDGG